MTKKPKAVRNRISKSWNWIEAHATFQGDECLFWPFGRTPGGYGHLRHKNRQMSAHRAMCELVNGSPVGSVHAAHSCGMGRQGCVNPRHLRWASAKENCADKVKHGTVQEGERNGAAILSAEAVLKICADRRRNSIVAKDWGVSGRTVAAIRRREKWTSATAALSVEAEGNLCRGEDHPQVKFSTDQVLEIFKDQRSQRKIAAAFGCSRGLVASIKSGRVWGHVTGQPRRVYPFEMPV